MITNIRQPESDVNVFAILKFMIAKIHIIAGLTIFGLVAGLALYFILPVKYESRVSFVSRSTPGISDQARNMGGGGLGALTSALVGFSLPSSNTTLYMTLLISNRVRDEIISSLNLAEHYHSLPTSARSILTKATVFKELKGGLLELTVRDSEPEMAQKIANEYVTSLNSALNSMNLTEAQKKKKFLEDRIALMEKELASAQQARTSRVKEVIYIELLKEYEITRAKEAQERIDVEVVDPPEVPNGPSFPKLKLLVILGLLGGFVISLFVVFFQMAFSSLLQDPESERTWLEIKDGFRMKRHSG